MTKLDNKPYYVTLTGSKNNAGDFLIRHRGIELLKKFRPDREIIDLSAWKEFSNDDLELINHAQALILLGGPSMQRNMHPTIYPLRADLTEVKCPIITMGIGAKPKKDEVYSDSPPNLGIDTIKLLEKINGSGFQSSVRDFYTLRTLDRLGFRMFRMTGCPALYTSNQQSTQSPEPSASSKICFSTGVTFFRFRAVDSFQKKTMLELQNKYADNFTVAFHHGTSQEFLDSHSPNIALHKAQLELIEWLRSKKIKYIDISADHEKMLRFYYDQDMHIGYRVHAHIAMTSLNKASILLAEDGRALALKDSIGGLIFDDELDKSPITWLLKPRKIDLNVKKILHMASTKSHSGLQQIQLTLQIRELLFREMHNFLLQLP